MGLGGLFVAQMEGLGIVLACELKHFLPRHVIMAEQRFVADLQIVEIDHLPTLPLWFAMESGKMKPACPFGQAGSKFSGN
jgi:hypothetical protein